MREPPGERSISLIDGYIGDSVYTNLKAMAQIATNHPEKIFVMAGGNPSWLEEEGLVFPDIREARRRLENNQEWPENAIVAGLQVMDSDFTGFSPLGADYYVSYTDIIYFGFPQAVTFATAMGSGMVNEARRLGLHDCSGQIALINRPEGVFDYADQSGYRTVDIKQVINGLDSLRQDD